MKNLKQLFLLLQLILMPTNLIWGQTWTGSGDTPEDPYKIISKEQLVELADSVNTGITYNGKYFILTSDVDLSAYGTNYDNGKGWKPIGYYNSSNEKGIFQGNLDGNGHRITGLIINRNNENYIGLFGFADGIIKNLGLEVISIGGKENIGGLIGCSNSTIENCYVSGGIINGIDTVGGLVGKNLNGNIVNCYTSCIVNGTSYIGGFAGYSSATIKNSYACGSVMGSNYVGSLIGYSNGIITNCYSSDLNANSSIGYNQGVGIPTALSNITIAIHGLEYMPNLIIDDGINQWNDGGRQNVNNNDSVYYLPAPKPFIKTDSLVIYKLSFNANGGILAENTKDVFGVSGEKTIIPKINDP
ncbi:MAG: GLUG motif-containing protein, partial [Dysgonomonas sp.]